MSPKRPIEQGDDITTADASAVKAETKSEKAVEKQQSATKSETTAIQRCGSESPNKKARAQQAFTKEEDDIIISHLLRDKDMPGIKKLLPNRNGSSLRCRVDLLTKKIKALAGS